MTNSNEKVSFFKRKNIELSVKRYLIDTLSFMALGLFSSLIIGSILNTVGSKLGIPFLSETVWPIASSMTGPAIAIAVAYGLQAPPLVLFSAAVVGAAGAANGGGPVGALLATLVAVEFGKMVSKETKVDIIVTPATTIVVGCLVASFVAPAVGAFMTKFGELIMYATELHPVPMGALVAVLMGIALTLPISSAAIAIMLSLSGIAAGAAVVGCCCQMVGFAVQSYKDNGWGGVFAQGLGTSMLQVSNIVKKPVIWLPPIIASAILGPISTRVLQMENTPMGAGMGTSGLVGQFEAIAAMDGGAGMYLSIFLMHIALPAIIVFVIAKFMYAKQIIKPGDMKLDL